MKNEHKGDKDVQIEHMGVRLLRGDMELRGRLIGGPVGNWRQK